MKVRRKHTQCLNCGFELLESHNFCPNCGQENTNNEVSFKLLFREFTSNFFSLDSRFGRTIKPFLFQPGKITNAFIKGQRVKYANPLRWYLVISLFHFFFFNWLISENSSFVYANSSYQSKDMSQDTFDSLYYLPASLHDDEWPIASHYEILIMEMAKNDQLTVDMIMDSLAFNDLPFMKKRVVIQLIKLKMESSKSIGDYVLGQFPLIVFLILPLSALILKLFFWKRGGYLKHLIHSIHLHSLTLFVLGCSYILSLFAYNQTKNFILISLGIISLYLLISIRNVYKVSWSRAIARLFIIGSIYGILFAVAMTMGLVASLLFF